MERSRVSYEYLQQQTAAHGTNISPAGTALYGVVVVYILYQVFAYFDCPILSPHELLWNALVYILPTHLLLDAARRQELKANGMLSQVHAAKSDTLRRMLGMGGSAVLQDVPAGGFMRRASTGFFARPKVTSDAPPGLGNWDNSCYQNSVLQGLASLQSLTPYLERTTGQDELESGTSSSLLETVGRLKDAGNNGKQLWTPAKLKSMSSWQQQDAQEYFSKIMDELDKEAAKVTAANSEKSGLETVAEKRLGSNEEEQQREEAARNPMEGLLAQKVACTRCGFSEGLSMIPFNCVTVPLGSDFAYDLDECLDEYTKLEEISDVECAKCTLLRAEKQLTAMLPKAPTEDEDGEQPDVDSKVLALPPELRAQAFKRLSAIQTALGEDDFEDKTLAEKCEIGKKARVSSTKTRQAVVARAPHSLVVHVNRSVFDEMTGAQRKNYANVRWPGTLELGAWMLKSGSDGGVSLLSGRGEAAGGAKYRIKAVVTHYGRHENGHYICYRRHPVQTREQPAMDEEDAAEKVDDDVPAKQQLEERWWRLSDEDVSSVSEDEVLAQGGVFMLFYERIDDGEHASVEPDNVAAAEEAPVESAIETVDEKKDGKVAVAEEEPASETVSEEIAKPQALAERNTESKTGAPKPPEERSSPSPTPSSSPRKATTAPKMRTARGRQASESDKAFAGLGGMRPVAAT